MVVHGLRNKPEVAEMLMRSVLNARISNELEDEIKAFYEKWAEYAESGSILDDKEVKELQEWWKRITDKGLQFRDEAAAITGYDKYLYIIAECHRRILHTVVRGHR